MNSSRCPFFVAMESIAFVIKFTSLLELDLFASYPRQSFVKGGSNDDPICPQFVAKDGPSWPSWLSKTYLKSDHFSGGSREPQRSRNLHAFESEASHEGIFNCLFLSGHRRDHLRRDLQRQ
jgi:hypothetical protein